eukprot:355301-Chlamydomonas_euryale.AAC.6
MEWQAGGGARPQPQSPPNHMTGKERTDRPMYPYPCSADYSPLAGVRALSDDGSPQDRAGMSRSWTGLCIGCGSIRQTLLYGKTDGACRFL